VCTLEHLEVHLDGRQRREQLVGRIGDECLLGGQRPFEPSQQGVQGCRDRGDFGRNAAGSHRLQCPRRTLRDFLRKAPQWDQAAPDEIPDEHGDHGDHRRQKQPQAPFDLARCMVAYGHRLSRNHPGSLAGDAVGSPQPAAEQFGRITDPLRALQDDTRAARG
jgi:hypothetical protein